MKDRNRAIESAILTIRGQKVILDRDMAAIYGVPTFRFNEAVKRNRERFPADFAFQLTAREFTCLISQHAISSSGYGGCQMLEEGIISSADEHRLHRFIERAENIKSRNSSRILGEHHEKECCNA